MSKKSVNEETRTSIDNINDSLTGLSESVQKNKKKIAIVAIILAAIIIGVLVYIFLINKPAVAKQDNAIAQADRELLMTGNDSIATEMYLKVAEGGYDAGNRAKLMAAIGLYKQAKYEDAIKCLQAYSASDDFIGAAAYSLLGDCYVNIDKLDEAVSAFKDAISQSDNNTYYTPVFMVKLAHVYNAQGKHAEEAELYQQIVDKYPEFLANTGLNIKKDLERAKILAGNK